MNYEEFKQRTTEKATYETFQKFEKMYMAGDLDKDIFCRLMKPLVVAMTEAAPYEEENDDAHINYHRAITNAHVAMGEGRIDDFIAAMETATDVGRNYILNKQKVDAILAKLK